MKLHQPRDKRCICGTDSMKNNKTTRMNTALDLIRSFRSLIGYCAKELNEYKNGITAEIKMPSNLPFQSLQRFVENLLRQI